MSKKDLEEYSIADLLAPAEEKFKRLQLHPHLINDLTQVRDSTDDEEIAELMEGILEKGQLNDGQVAALLPHEAGVYVATWNAIRHTDHRVEDLVFFRLEGVRICMVRVAGHRRGLVIKRLNEEGKRSPKFNGMYKAGVYFGIGAEEAIEIQIQENHYRPPHPNEQAKTVWDYYCYKKSKDPKLTLKKFSAKFGHSEEWVRRAARFCGLPDSLQMLARGGKGMAKVPYGILVEAGKHQEDLLKLKKPISEHDLARLVFDAVAKKTTTREFAKQLSARFDHIKNGVNETGFFDTMQEQRIPLRRIVDQGLEAGALSFLALTEHVEVFFGPGGPFANMTPDELRSRVVGSSGRITVQGMEKMVAWVPRLQEFYALRNDGKTLALPDLTEAQEVLDLFEVLVHPRQAVAAE